jgi:DNA invertase Pin-like site-specific DNA recombinase
LPGAATGCDSLGSLSFPRAARRFAPCWNSCTVDRLARSIGDLQDIVRTVRARGAVLKATEQPIDTGTAAGKCFLDMLGVFAEFETKLRRERQLEGIAKAKAAGVYKGRPPSIEASRVRELKAQGMRPVDIAKALKIGRASVYRVLGTGGG